MVGIPASIALRLPGQPGRFFRADYQDIDTLTNQVFDIGHLFLGLVLSVRDNQFQVGMLFRLLLHVLVELNPPGFNDRDLRETESNFFDWARTWNGLNTALAAAAALILMNVLLCIGGVRCYGGLVLVDLLAATWQDWSC